MSNVTTPLPSFLPHPGDQLRSLFPLGHTALSDVLGLALCYLKAMHPTKQSKTPDLAASAHILSLFINDPLIKSIIPPGPTSHLPSKELTLLQGKISSLENTVTALAKLTAKATVPSPPAQHPANKPRTGPTANPQPQPTYATVASSPRPSIVVGAAAYTWSGARPSPSDVCATINRTIGKSHPQTQLSTAKWTKLGNLVIWGGPHTTAQHLALALPHITEALQASFAVLSDNAPSNPPLIRPNVKWSKLTINNIPTGKTTSQGVYDPNQCHQALLVENPAYAALNITQKPSWVRAPSSYNNGTSSSLTFSFKDPDGTRATSLLRLKNLYAFGNIGTVKKWKQKPPQKKISPDRALPPPQTPRKPGPSRPLTRTPGPLPSQVQYPDPSEEELQRLKERALQTALAAMKTPTGKKKA